MLKAFLIGICMNMVLGMGTTETYTFVDTDNHVWQEMTYWLPCDQCAIKVREEVYNW